MVAPTRRPTDRGVLAPPLLFRLFRPVAYPPATPFAAVVALAAVRPVAACYF